jgi:hypothetical protein
MLWKSEGNHYKARPLLITGQQGDCSLREKMWDCVVEEIAASKLLIR